jgi:hypothetical protein
VPAKDDEPINIDITAEGFFEAVEQDRRGLAEMFALAETSDDPDAVQLRAALGMVGLDVGAMKRRLLDDAEVAKRMKEESKEKPSG